MKLEDLFEIENTDPQRSTARDFGSHKAAVASEKADRAHKEGYHHGYTGKKPSSRNPQYMTSYKMGKETRAAHKKDGRLKEGE